MVANQNNDMLAVLKERALKIVSESAGGDKVAKNFDPSIWLPLFTALLEVIGECMAARRTAGAADPKSEVAKVIKAPTTMQRLRFRRAMIRHAGRATVRKHDRLVDAVVDVGQTAEPAEIDLFLEQVTA